MSELRQIVNKDYVHEKVCVKYMAIEKFYSTNQMSNYCVLFSTTLK